METRNAFLAMMLLSMLALQFQRHTSQSRVRMMRSEVQMMASGVGTQHLDQVGLLDFDEITDLNGFEETVSVPVEDGTFTFNLSTQVRFVEKTMDAFEAAENTTDHQEVSVTIDGLLKSKIVLSRIFSRATRESG